MELLSNKLAAAVAGGQSLFLAAVAAQGHTGSTLVATFASNSGAMVAGYKSKVLGIDYEEIPGTLTNVPDLTADQVITIGNEQFILQPQFKADGVTKNKPKAPVLKFEVGARTMTLGLLQQGQDKTIINFVAADGSVRSVPSNKLTLDDLSAMIGKNWFCSKFWKDASAPIIRNNADGTQQPGRPANCYTIDITG